MTVGRRGKPPPVRVTKARDGEARPAGAKRAAEPPVVERILHGVGVAPGIAVGPIHAASEPVAEIGRRAIEAGERAAELHRLEEAVQLSRRQLGKLRHRLAVLPEDSQAEIAPLIDAYLQMLGSRLVRNARRRIEVELVSAEVAVHDEADALAATLMALPGDVKAARQRRADEVRETGRRLIRNLTHAPFRSYAGLPLGAVVAAETLRPADAALLDPARVAGLAAEEGGSDGHASIMLRALGIPAVLGVHGLIAALRPGTAAPAVSSSPIAIVDGERGEIVLDPGPATLAEARRRVGLFARERQRLARLRRLPARTLDDEAVELQGNLELLAELPLIAQSGATGIGLLRSEFLFMNRASPPDEAQQFDAYRHVIDAMDGDCVTIRVLDWGGEKEIDALAERHDFTHETNPALGLRGIRLLLRDLPLFETQLAAILRAAQHGKVRVLLPMVTTIGEMRQSREVLDRVARRLRRRGERIADKLPPLGAMIETPGAALSADALALEADFFAIGTNDLAMYALAVDRASSEVAGLYDPLHPSVLRLIQFATEAALRLRMPVSICGEMAANPRLTPLLLGLGLRSFSMNASAVPRVKQAVRGLAIDDCARFARRVMEQSDPEVIQALVMGFSESS